MRNSALVMIKISINTRDVMEFITRSLRSLVINSITSLVLNEILIITRANYLIRLRKPYSNIPLHLIWQDAGFLLVFDRILIFTSSTETTLLLNIIESSQKSKIAFESRLVLDREHLLQNNLQNVA